MLFADPAEGDPDTSGMLQLALAVEHSDSMLSLGAAPHHCPPLPFVPVETMHDARTWG